MNLKPPFLNSSFIIPNSSFKTMNIVKTKAVCGGAARIENTRMPVWVLENARQAGLSDSEILENYPFLTSEILQTVWEYIDSNSDDVRSEIREFSLNSEK